MYHIQEFMRERIYEEPTGKRTITPPIITPKFPETRNCSALYCESCTKYVGPQYETLRKLVSTRSLNVGNYSHWNYRLWWSY